MIVHAAPLDTAANASNPRDRFTPKLSDLKGIWELTQQRCKLENKKETSSRLMFPPRLQALVELESRRRSADEYFVKAAESAICEGTQRPRSQEEYGLALLSRSAESELHHSRMKKEICEGTRSKNFDRLDEVEQLKNVISMAQALGGNQVGGGGRVDITSFDPSLFQMAKFQTTMHRCFQSSHGVETIPTHASSCNFHGSSSHQGTDPEGVLRNVKKLIVSFDGRWNLPKGDSFELQYEETHGVWKKCRVTPGKSRVISSNTLKWKYTHGGVPSKSFGYRFTVRPMRDVSSSLLSVGLNPSGFGTRVGRSEATTVAGTGAWYPTQGDTSMLDFDAEEEKSRVSHLKEGESSESVGAAAALELREALKIAVRADPELDRELVSWLNSRVAASVKKITKRDQNQNEHDEPTNPKDMATA